MSYSGSKFLKLGQNVPFFLIFFHQDPMILPRPGKPASFPEYFVHTFVSHSCRVDEIALNIDLTPTFLDIANSVRPKFIDGTSLMDVAVGSLYNRIKRLVPLYPSSWSSWNEVVLGNIFSQLLCESKHRSAMVIARNFSKSSS